MSKLKCQIILIEATQNSGSLFTFMGRPVEGNPKKEFCLKTYHMYFLSKEKIEYGDYYCVPEDKFIGKCNEALESNLSANKEHNEYHYKVEASTDSSLGIPVIPVAFLKQYEKELGEIKEIELSATELYDFKEGDKLEVISDVYGHKKGSYVTVKEFKHNNNPSLVSIEEDDKLQCGFHVRHLKYKTYHVPRITIDNECMILDRYQITSTKVLERTGGYVSKIEITQECMSTGKFSTNTYLLTKIK